MLKQILDSRHVYRSVKNIFLNRNKIEQNQQKRLALNVKNRKFRQINSRSK